jgi:hypothetical protein
MYKFNKKWVSTCVAVILLGFSFDLKANDSVPIQIRQSTKNKNQAFQSIYVKGNNQIIFRKNTMTASSFSQSTSLENLLRQAAEKSTLNFVEITDIEILELNSQTALLLVNIREAGSPVGSAAKTHGVVVKTSDGGANWRIILDTGESSTSSDRGTGSLVVNESFLLRNDSDDNINNLWLVTQWQIEATFPTIYWTNDGGETWQKSGAVGTFLASKGHVTFNYAEGLRFRNKNEGIVIARAEDGKSSIYFLQTSDSGKTWKEIPSVPSWYFQIRNAKKSSRIGDSNFQIVNHERGFSVLKILHSFPRILKMSR